MSNAANKAPSSVAGSGAPVPANSAAAAPSAPPLVASGPGKKGAEDIQPPASFVGPVMPKVQHPLFTTTANDYGSTPATDFPGRFTVSQKFTEHLSRSGLYRNYSLNTKISP
ncbi:hypothetical protein AMAG_01914 [Allomyces macrogynus ATCC 38327]|uniref:Uncharacterized protein n=1 Tax=Allomyces macrogynus (strain ATCC 38327) TaxID=578462 RepID=A0A0L0S0C2_ALLM3|nr:hypothetical protein AMAG_01914 [Allomyces macrogynus ATCC 38327]|eukprot:KNE56072.1 hypothetical protein AMAG_01914 [Allomyces macrogynus ATCC 38327]